MMEQAVDNKRGWRAMEWTRDDRQQQISNQPCRDTALKTRAASTVNGVFCCCVDHSGGRKVGGDGRAAVDTKQQWQQQSGNNQLKVTVASGGLDCWGYVIS
jgi:hypothetical protein